MNNQGRVSVPRHMTLRAQASLPQRTSPAHLLGRTQRPLSGSSGRGTTGKMTTTPHWPLPTLGTARSENSGWAPPWAALRRDLGTLCHPWAWLRTNTNSQPSVPVSIPDRTELQNEGARSSRGGHTAACSLETHGTAASHTTHRAGAPANRLRAPSNPAEDGQGSPVLQALLVPQS